MAVSKQEIIESIASMSVLELSELIKDVEKKFGVSAAAAVAVAAPAAGAAAAPAAEKTEFTMAPRPSKGRAPGARRRPARSPGVPPPCDPGTGCRCGRLPGAH